MVVKDLRPTGRRTSLVVLARGDPVLMVRSILWWLRSHFISGAVCACVSACLLLHYCSVCQVRNGKWQLYPERRYRLQFSPRLSDVFANVMLLQKDNTSADYIKCDTFGYSNVMWLISQPLVACQYVTVCLAHSMQSVLCSRDDLSIWVKQPVSQPAGSSSFRL